MLNVNSEIGTLKKVIIHRPDDGIARISPKKAEELLFDDIVHLPQMKEEHDVFRRVLQHIVGKENVLDFFRRKVAGRAGDLSAKQKLVVRDHSLNNKECIVQGALLGPDGTAFGGLITLKPVSADYALNLSDLKPVKQVTLPRPYPTFLPYYVGGEGKPDLANVEALQISIGPGVPSTQLHAKHGIAIESVRLE